MFQRRLLVGLALAVPGIHGQLFAQFTDPRTYDNAPVGVNQLELSYAHARANASIDTSLVVAGAEFNANQGTIAYTRYFSLVHQLAWVNASVPYAGVNGSVSALDIHGSISGTGDSSYQMAMLLKGGEALSVAQFANYKPATTIGMSLTVTAPTGQYDADKLINLGSNRVSLKPEIAVSCPFGPKEKWEFDAYANAYFYTDNTSYHGAETLRQNPIPGLEGHLSHSFRSNLWASLDTRYSFGGDTFVNGANQNSVQQNFILGSELNLSLNDQNTLVLEVAKALVHQNGPASGGFAVKYYYSWSKRRK